MAKRIPFSRPLPSEHEAARVRNAETLAREQEAVRARENRRQRAFDWLLQQENGRIVWAWLFDRCGWVKPALMRVAGGDVAPLSTEAAAAQREVYRDARRMATPELLAKAEYEAEFGEVKPKDTKGEKKDG